MKVCTFMRLTSTESRLMAGHSTDKVILSYAYEKEMVEFMKSQLCAR
jgi:hypothetical protein